MSRHLRTGGHYLYNFLVSRTWFGLVWLKMCLWLIDLCITVTVARRSLRLLAKSALNAVASKAGGNDLDAKSLDSRL